MGEFNQSGKAISLQDYENTLRGNFLLHSGISELIHLISIPIYCFSSCILEWYNWYMLWCFVAWITESSMHLKSM